MRIIITLLLLGFTCCPVKIYAAEKFGYSKTPTAQEMTDLWWAGKK